MALAKYHEIGDWRNVNECQSILICKIVAFNVSQVLSKVLDKSFHYCSLIRRINTIGNKNIQRLHKV